MKIFLLALFFSLTTLAGNDVENGGDPVAFEFTTSARLVMGNLKKSKLNPELTSLVRIISKSLEITKVNSLPHLFLKNAEVDAINFPVKKQILISRSRWKIAKIVSIESRMGFLLHEYLGVSGIDDGNYRLSQKLVEAMNPDAFGSILAQETFMKHTSELGGYLWNLSLDPFPTSGHKEVCIIAGEINVRVQIITQTVAANPTWFRSEAIEKYSTELQTVAAEIKKQCLGNEVDYRTLEKSFTRGHDLVGYFEVLMFSR